VKIYAWTGSNYLVDSGDTILSPYWNGWDNGGIITLNPGQAVWFCNPNQTNMIVVFQGNVPTGTLTTKINGPGLFNMISSPVPVGSDLVANPLMNFTNFYDGDEVFVWNDTSGWTWYAVDMEFGTPGYLSQWDPPGDPQVNVGQGFWYKTSPKTPNFTWTETFSSSPNGPQLSIAGGSSGSVLITWPSATPASYVLQQSLNVTGPWTTVTTVPSQVSTNYQVAVATTASVQFFRLMSP
jgi:hypothetical protein